MPEPKLDILGQTFGRLLVTDRLGTNKHRQPVFLCDCACGNTDVEVLRSSLLQRRTISCGCYRVECGISSPHNYKHLIERGEVVRKGRKWVPK